MRQPIGGVGAVELPLYITQFKIQIELLVYFELIEIVQIWM